MPNPTIKEAKSSYSTIIGGRNNTANGYYSTMSGGYHSIPLAFSLDKNCGIIKTKDVLNTLEYIIETNSCWENFHASKRITLVEKNVPIELYKRQHNSNIASGSYSCVIGH